MPFHDKHGGSRGGKALVTQQSPFRALYVDFRKVGFTQQRKRIDSDNLIGDGLASQRDRRIGKATAGEGNHARLGRCAGGNDRPASGGVVQRDTPSEQRQVVGVWLYRRDCGARPASERVNPEEPDVAAEVQHPAWGRIAELQGDSGRWLVAEIADKDLVENVDVAGPVAQHHAPVADPAHLHASPRAKQLCGVEANRFLDGGPAHRRLDHRLCAENANGVVDNRHAIAQPSELDHRRSVAHTAPQRFAADAGERDRWDEGVA